MSMKYSTNSGPNHLPPDPFAGALCIDVTTDGCRRSVSLLATYQFDLARLECQSNLHDSIEIRHIRQLCSIKRVTFAGWKGLIYLFLHEFIAKWVGQ